MLYLRYKLNVNLKYAAYEKEYPEQQCKKFRPNRKEKVKVSKQSNKTNKAKATAKIKRHKKESEEEREENISRTYMQCNGRYLWVYQRHCCKKICQLSCFALSQ